MVKISQVFIQSGNKLLLQLRDFNSGIDFPGHWGFFAGHQKEGETPAQAMIRELEEELNWTPKRLRILGAITLDASRLINAYHCQLRGSIDQLNLQEGQEIGAFSQEEIMSGKLYSSKWYQKYPISPVSIRVYERFKKELKKNAH